MCNDVLINDNASGWYTNIYAFSMNFPKIIWIFDSFRIIHKILASSVIQTETDALYELENSVCFHGLSEWLSVEWNANLSNRHIQFSWWETICVLFPSLNGVSNAYIFCSAVRNNGKYRWMNSADNGLYEVRIWKINKHFGVDVNEH